MRVHGNSHQLLTSSKLQVALFPKVTVGSNEVMHPLVQRMLNKSQGQCDTRMRRMQVTQDSSKDLFWCISCINFYLQDYASKFFTPVVGSGGWETTTREKFHKSHLPPLSKKIRKDMEWICCSRWHNVLRKFIVFKIPKILMPHGANTLQHTEVTSTRSREHRFKNLCGFNLN